MKKTTIIFAAFLFSAALCHAQGVDGTEKSGLGGRDPWPDTNFPFWVDEVTEQPSGYVVDANGNVEILTAEGLAWLPSVVNGLNGCAPDNFEGRTVRLTTDIDLDAVAQLRFTPIGNREHPFKGVFDGGGHTIDGLYISFNYSYDHSFPTFDCAMFGYLLHGTVKDVVINSGVVDCGHNQYDEVFYTGGLVGVSDSLTIVDGCIVKMRMGSRGDDNNGCIVGLNRNSIVRNCAYCYGDNAICWNEGGGIVCKNLSEGGYADAEVANCFFYGYIVDPVGGGHSLAGVVSVNETDPKSQTGGYKAIVKNCFAESIATIRAMYAGSVVAQNKSGSLVENCYGHIWNNYEDAGLFGFTLGDIAECAEFLPTGPCQLETSVMVGSTSTDVMVDALNAWVDMQEDPSIYKHWVSVYEPYNIPMFEDGILSVGENGTKASTTDVYPNPGKDVFNIRTALPNAYVEVYDMNGKLIHSQALTENATGIDATDWAEGVYVWKVIADGKEAEVGKWIKE